MKNQDNPTLLAHKRRFDEKRRKEAIEKKKRENLAALRKVGGQK